MAKREYQNDYPSVTQVLGVLRARGLEEWFKRTPYSEIMEQTKKAKAIGNSIHQSIQSYIETGSAKIDTEYPDEVTNALKSFMAFRKDYPDVKLRRSEMALTSERYKFNGTIDCIGIYKNSELGEFPVILDWKTGKKGDKERPPIFDEYKIQISAYLNLFNEHISDKEIIENGLIVAIAKDTISYNTYEMNKAEIDGCFTEVFLPCLKIFNYQRKEKQNV